MVMSSYSSNYSASNSFDIENFLIIKPVIVRIACGWNCHFLL